MAAHRQGSHSRDRVVPANPAKGALGQRKSAELASVSPRREIFAKLSPRFAGGDAEGRGGSGITIATAPNYLVEQSQTPSVAPRHLPRRAGEKQKPSLATVSVGGDTETTGHGAHHSIYWHKTVEASTGMTPHAAELMYTSPSQLQQRTSRQAPSPSGGSAAYLRSFVGGRN